MKVNIEQVKGAIKIADAVLNSNTENDKPWIFVYTKTVGKDILGVKCGRVYFFVVDGNITKIGGSADKMGMKDGTLKFYEEGMKGTPGMSRFGICWLIRDCLNNGKRVEVYMMLSHEHKGIVKGLFSEEIKIINSYKEMEEQCLDDYKNRTGEFPEWNYQENGSRWSNEIRLAHSQLTGKPVKNEFTTK